MTETLLAQRSKGFPVWLIAVIAVLAGMAIGAGGLYLLGFKPQKGIADELGAKTAEIETMQAQVDSLIAEMEAARVLDPHYEESLKLLMQPDSLNKIVTLGTALGGTWLIYGVEDVTFLERGLAFVRIDDGHLAGMALLRVGDANNTKTWSTLWADYY